MLISMTGFAHKTETLADQEGNEVTIIITIKSLNARFFESVCKLPYIINYLEPVCIKILKKILHRGTITLNIQYTHAAAIDTRIEPNISVAKAYMAAAEHIKTQTGITGTLTLNDLMRYEPVLDFQEFPLEERLNAKILGLVEKTVQELLSMRIEEGKELYEDIKKRIDIIKNELDDIKHMSMLVSEEKKQTISQKLGIAVSMIEDISAEQRAAYFLELGKIDIHEEIVRLDNHISTFEKTLHASGQEKGRRLDFITQELGREINTIAAKSCDTRISAYAINIKVEIEKIREQIQNIV